MQQAIDFARTNLTSQRDKLLNRGRDGGIWRWGCGFSMIY
jgi:hypothetical protein